MEKLRNEFIEHKTYFERCGIDLSMLDYELSNYDIIMHRQMFQKKNGRYSVLLEDDRELLTPRAFACYVSSLSFFGSRIKKRYHYLGYIVYKLTDYNPDRTIKQVATFKFEKKEGK